MPPSLVALKKIIVLLHVEINVPISFNPTYWGLKQEEHKFKSNLDNLVRSYLTKKEKEVEI